MMLHEPQVAPYDPERHGPGHQGGWHGTTRYVVLCPCQHSPLWVGCDQQGASEYANGHRVDPYHR